MKEHFDHRITKFDVDLSDRPPNQIQEYECVNVLIDIFATAVDQNVGHKVKAKFSTLGDCRYEQIFGAQTTEVHADMPRQDVPGEVVNDSLDKRPCPILKA